MYLFLCSESFHSFFRDKPLLNFFEKPLLFSSIAEDFLRQPRLYDYNSDKQAILPASQTSLYPILILRRL